MCQLVELASLQAIRLSEHHSSSKLEDTVTALEATAEEQDSKISELEKAVSEISVEEVEEEDAERSVEPGQSNDSH